MFWQKTVALLGLLSGLGSASPPLVKRVDPSDMGYEPDVYFRADRRGHAAIKADGGFKAWAKTNSLPPNLSLWDHCKEKDAKFGFGNLQNDGFVGMSSDIDVTLKWVVNYIEDSSTTTSIYRIAQDMNLLACSDILKQHNSIAAESEYVVIGEVPWDQVVGWFDTFTVRGGHITDAEWHPNPDFKKSKYANKPYGTDVDAGADPKDFLPLAGFPKGDKRWKEKPWNTVAPANCGSKKRSIFDDFEDGVMDIATGGNETEIEDPTLVARGRGGSRGGSRSRPAKRPTRKTPKKKVPKKKPAKKPAKKHPKKPKKATCSAAIKKKNGGVCPKKTTTCSAAIKKKNGGVCPKKTTTCSAAIKKKNGGVCPKKTTCTAAAKKKNGGVCPATCSAAIKKKNGGVCPPTCTAAEKKANGGTCPTCTAAEKKKNGGKCPPKSCPLPKTNKQLADEYIRKYKAGLLGKGKKGKGGKKGGKKGH